MQEPESLLPPEIRAGATKSGNEYGWPFDLVSDVLEAARSQDFACLGGQPQFVLPGGTCELWWENFDSSDKDATESWRDFVDRTHREVLAGFQRLSVDDLLAEGMSKFRFLQERASEGSDLRENLIFILYFLAEQKAT